MDARAQMCEAIVGRQRLRHAAGILTYAAWCCALGRCRSCGRTGNRRAEIKAAEAMFEGVRRVRGHASCIDGDIYWRRCGRVDPALVVGDFLIDNHIVRPTCE
jgi:hypothetical protein